MKARFAASVALATGLLLGSTACTFWAEIPTEFDYAPADGASATVGEVEVRNALLVAGEGGNYSLAMGLSNNGDENLTVQFEYNFDTGNAREFTLDVEPGQLLAFGSEILPAVLIEDMQAEVGGGVEMYVQYGNEPGELMLVPVYDGRLPRFAEIEPELPEEIEIPSPENTETPTVEEPAATEG